MFNTPFYKGKPSYTLSALLTALTGNQSLLLGIAVSCLRFLWHCSFAVKTIAKRWAPGAQMEPLFVRRIQHEVDIYNHIGKPTACAHIVL